MAIRVVSKTPIPSSSIALGTAPIDVPIIMQEQKNWSWAACADMILHYYNNPGITQCELANWAFGQSSCCQTPSSSLCDRGLSISEISQLFSEYGLKSIYNGGEVSYGVLKDEFDSNRPVEVALAWTGGGGQYVVVVDMFIFVNEPMVLVRDPVRGGGAALLKNLRTAFGLGQWISTWTGIQR